MTEQLANVNNLLKKAANLLSEAEHCLTLAASETEEGQLNEDINNTAFIIQAQESDINELIETIEK